MQIGALKQAQSLLFQEQARQEPRLEHCYREMMVHFCCDAWLSGGADTG